jgi:hypothetical protein
MWSPPWFAWSGRRDASRVAAPHPSVHPLLETLEERLNLWTPLGPVILPPPPPGIGGQTAGSVAVQITFQFNTPRQFALGAAIREFATGQTVSEGRVAFTLYNGPDSSSPVLQQMGPVPVDNQGNVQVPVTLPTNLAPGTYLILASYTDQGGGYSNNGGSATLTIGPVSMSEARIAVTPTPAVLQTSSSPQQVLLNASARDFSTEQPVTEGTITFRVFNGSDSSSTLLGEIPGVPVDSQGEAA